MRGQELLGVQLEVSTHIFAESQIPQDAFLPIGTSFVRFNTLDSEELRRLHWWIDMVLCPEMKDKTHIIIV